MIERRVKTTIVEEMLHVPSSVRIEIVATSRFRV